MIGKKVLVGFTSIYTHRKSDMLPVIAQQQAEQERERSSILAAQLRALGIEPEA